MGVGKFIIDLGLNVGKSLLAGNDSLKKNSGRYNNMTLKQLIKEQKNINRTESGNEATGKSVAIGQVINNRKAQIENAKSWFKDNNRATVSYLGKVIKDKPNYDPAGEAARELIERMANTGDLAAQEAIRILKQDRHW